MKQFLNYAADRYYEGFPIISDAEFDSLATKYGYKNVGAKSTDEIPHLYPMFSLKKCFSADEIPSNFDVSSPKLDGAAVSLVYVNGYFSHALTRGDGKKGNDITDKMTSLVPHGIPEKGIFQITGEVCAPKTIQNARNYASGALGLKSLGEFLERDLTFIAYECTPNTDVMWEWQMRTLIDWGFTVASDDHDGDKLEDIFPIDGKVYRINDYDKFFAAGFTSHHPKGAIALKEIKEGVRTTLLDVAWQVGRSGVVAPVAILVPINIDGAMVSRATLHNIEYIRGLDLEIGCEVEVIRSGEIIPRVIGRV